MGFLDIINVPLGYLFRIIYLIVKNYGWALVLFTVITKAILLPLSIKQQKSMSKMQAVQPKLNEIQRKYQYDKEKLNQETMKIYQENKINPMGGCLPLLIQFPVLIGLYNIIRMPLTYVLKFGSGVFPTVQQVLDILTPMGFTGTIHDEIKIADYLFNTQGALEAVQAAFPQANIISLDFNFLGMNLSQTPNFMVLSPLLLIPILAGVTSYLTSWVSNKLNGNSAKSSNGQENTTASTMQTMTYIFPFMTVFFAFSLPEGLGSYWILSNIVQIIQQVVLTKYFAKTAVPEESHVHYREREKKRRKS